MKGADGGNGWIMWVCIRQLERWGLICLVVHGTQCNTMRFTMNYYSEGKEGVDRTENGQFQKLKKIKKNVEKH